MSFVVKPLPAIAIAATDRSSPARNDVESHLCAIEEQTSNLRRLLAEQAREHDFDQRRLDEESAAAKTQLDTANAANTVLRAEVARVTDLLAAVQAERDRAARRCDDLGADLARATADAAAQAAATTAAKAEFDKEQQKTRTLREQLAKATADLAAAVKAAEQAVSDNKELQRRITAGAAAATTAGKTHAADLQALRAELDAAQKETRAKQALLERSEAQAKKSKSDFAAELKAQAVALNATIQDMLAEKATAAQEIARLELRVAQLLAAQTPKLTPAPAPAPASASARVAVDFDEAKMRLLIKQNKAEKKRLSDIQATAHQ